MEVRRNRLYLGGIAARDLVEKFGSPLYVYEEETIRMRARELQSSISYPDKEIKYACKANTNIEIMKILREEGMGIDAVSPGEIESAFRAGFKHSQILYTTNNVSFEELEFAVQKDVLVNIDSLSQLRRFGERFKGREICVRINPNVGAGHHNHCITGGPESKFGISYRKVKEVQEISAEHGLRVIGIHQHIGSGILSPDVFIEAMDVLLETAPSLSGLSFVDFGGGIGVPYRDGEKRLDMTLLGKEIARGFSDFCSRYGAKLKLVIEPGRYPVAESGFLLATVTVLKENEKYRFVGVDTGFNHLVRPAMYGSYHPIMHADSVNAVNGSEARQTVAGYICESGDTFTRDESGIADRSLPLFKEGDILAICNAGAYGYSMASNYNSRPRPAEVLVKGGSARLIRKRETVEDLFKNC